MLWVNLTVSAVTPESRVERSSIGLPEDITNGNTPRRCSGKAENLIGKPDSPIPDARSGHEHRGVIIFINETGFPALGYEKPMNGSWKKTSSPSLRIHICVAVRENMMFMLEQSYGIQPRRR